MSEDTTQTCAECSEVIEGPYADDARWSPVKEAMVCWPCYEGASQYASTLYHVGPDFVEKVYVHDLDIHDEWGEGVLLPISRRWVSTSAWRGYYTTEVEGFVEVETGWTTGGWGDPTSDRKQTFNDWAQSLVEGAVNPPVDVLLTFDPTSNVFSTGVGVLVRKDDVEAFTNWVGEEAKALHDSLT
jgi:hypothetical protein